MPERSYELAERRLAQLSTSLYSIALPKATPVYPVCIYLYYRIPRTTYTTYLSSRLQKNRDLKMNIHAQNISKSTISVS